MTSKTLGWEIYKNMKQKLIVILVIVFVISSIMFGWKLLPFLITSQEEAKLILERTIQNSLKNPQDVLADSKIIVERPIKPHSGIYEPIDLKFLNLLPEHKSIVCQDYASFVLYAHDWDCMVHFIDGNWMHVQAVWVPEKQVIRFNEIEKN